MAKYSDYVKEGSLEQEVQQVEEKKREIPESVVRRFDGKSIEDVLESYANLEKHAGQLGDRVGRLQSTVEDLLTFNATQAQAATKQPEVAAKPITGDDLYNDPEKAVTQVVEKKVNERLSQMETQLAKSEAQSKVAALTRRFPNWEAEVRTPEFSQWVNASPWRNRLAQAADKFDFDAATDLFSMWEDTKSATQKTQQAVRREQQFEDATLESTASRPVARKGNAYSRSEIQEKRIRAKQGDHAAERYLRAHADSIAEAYEKGWLTE